MASQRRGGGLALVITIMLAASGPHCSSGQSVDSESNTGNFCMANCTKPLYNTFCRVTEDVCAYPTGDFEAQRATRAVSVWLGQGLDNECLQKFRTFICSMYFPKCRYRITVPLCWRYCYDAYLTCVRDHTYQIPEEVATERCQALVATKQVADEACANGKNSKTGEDCACFNAATRTGPGSTGMLAIWGVAAGTVWFAAAARGEW